MSIITLFVVLVLILNVGGVIAKGNKADTLIVSLTEAVMPLSSTPVTTKV
jgi:hypothetical protein